MKRTRWEAATVYRKRQLLHRGGLSSLADDSCAVCATALSLQATMLAANPNTDPSPNPRTSRSSESVSMIV